MKSCMFDKPACQNIRESLRKEWLETNGLGDYASSTIPCCNTRKYHGLLVANLANPPGRHVLLSTLEEALVGGRKDFALSCRKHPGVYHPHGHDYMQKMEQGEWPIFNYRIGDLRLKKEVMMLHKRQITLIRYLFQTDDVSPLPLRMLIKPLLAFRNFHTLTFKNAALRPAVRKLRDGFMVKPYEALPSMYMQISQEFEFKIAPDWCERVEYLVEQERGFDFAEDLFTPGYFELPIIQSIPFYVSASTEEIKEPLEDLWHVEVERRAGRCEQIQSAMPENSSLMTHLAEQGEDFLIDTPFGGQAVLAGYHWFDAWGRDTCIALPGLTFAAGRVQEGADRLVSIGESAKGGLIPNFFNPDGVNHAYNSVDASLWYVWAVQQLDLQAGYSKLVKEKCWPIIKQIIAAFKDGPLPSVYVDEANFLHAGSEQTQLTWMDAMVNGKPMTPRYGFPVEINALWYNALAYDDALAKRYKQTDRIGSKGLKEMRRVFKERFWIKEHGGYLADVWRPDYIDRSNRPNQIFAVSLPFSILEEDDQAFIVQRVRNSLLTPFGIRTLTPSDPKYWGVYFGDIEKRDSSYHQGTVWPWLLGAYADALIRTSWDVDNASKELLTTVTPMFVKHLERAGLGSISEIFDASPPHYPNGCIAQAWSIAEVLRMLRVLQKAAPAVYAQWEESNFVR